MKLIFLAILGFLFLGANCSKDDDTGGGGGATPSYVNIEAKVLTPNLNYPWELIWGPDNFIWMTEKNSGKISRVDPINGAVITVFTIPDVVANGEGGLLGMALHPNFANTPYVYVAYNYNSGGYKEKVVRYSYNGTLISPVTLIDNINASGIHNGCRLLISPDQKLFITTGDASNSPIAQNASALNGKVLRLNLDGSIPADNPTAGSPVWSMGHRNPQGLVFANNIMYSSEHGPNNDDEVNIIEKGVNYGWPNVEGFCNLGSEQPFCAANNVREPLKAWTPTIAVCGLDFYDNDAIPQWKNSLLMCTLKDMKLVLLKLSADHRSITSDSIYFPNTYGRLRDICISPQGSVFMCSSNGGNADRIIEIKKRKPGINALVDCWLAPT